jgi:hypothetical protein
VKGCGRRPITRLGSGAGAGVGKPPPFQPGAVVDVFEDIEHRHVQFAGNPHGLSADRSQSDFVI